MDTNTTLNNLPLMQGAYIASVNIDGSMRRRLLDLGFATGNYVIPLFVSPLGDPTAYGIMGSVVALRNDIASKITISQNAPRSKLEVGNI